jgi:hypothetical protein
MKTFAQNKIVLNYLLKKGFLMLANYYNGIHIIAQLNVATKDVMEGENPTIFFSCKS